MGCHILSRPTGQLIHKNTFQCARSCTGSKLATSFRLPAHQQSQSNTLNRAPLHHTRGHGLCQLCCASTANLSQGNDIDHRDEPPAAQHGLLQHIYKAVNALALYIKEACQLLPLLHFPTLKDTFWLTVYVILGTGAFVVLLHYIDMACLTVTTSKALHEAFSMQKLQQGIQKFVGLFQPYNRS